MTEPIRVPLLLTATGSLAPDYFSQVYAAHEDPWDFQHSSYEAEKYRASLAALQSVVRDVGVVTWVFYDHASPPAEAPAFIARCLGDRRSHVLLALHIVFTAAGNEGVGGRR